MCGIFLVSLIFCCVLSGTPVWGYDPSCQTMWSNVSSGMVWSIPASGLPTFNCTCSSSPSYPTCPGWQITTGADRVSLVNNTTGYRTGTSCSALIQFNLAPRYNFSDVTLLCNASNTRNYYNIKVNATWPQSQYPQPQYPQGPPRFPQGQPNWNGYPPAGGPYSQGAPSLYSFCQTMDVMSPKNPWSTKSLGPVTLSCVCYATMQKATCPTWVFNRGSDKVNVLRDDTHELDGSCSTSLKFDLKKQYTSANISLSCDGTNLRRDFYFKVTSSVSWVQPSLLIQLFGTAFAHLMTLHL